MTQTHLTAADMLEALKMVGNLLDWPLEVEILLIGGAAGMLIGVLRPDRIAEMRITPDEVAFVRKYLNMLRTPCRKADLDQVASAQEYLRLLEGQLP